MVRKSIASLAAGLTMLCATTPRIFGQVVHGSITGAEPRPRAGIIVQLVDSSGAPVGQVLTRTDGGFRFTAPHEGTYRIRALRIGYKPSVSEAIDLLSGMERRVDVALSDKPVSLPAVTVNAHRTCGSLPDSGTRAWVVWTEVRKALIASQITRRDHLHHALLAVVEREVDRNNRVRRETAREASTSGNRPFFSIAVESLTARGYARMRPSGDFEYFGPDEDVLLSDVFASTHCLAVDGRARTRGNAAEIALTFSPIRGLDHPDIEGELWIDETSHELRSIEFHYTGLPAPLDDGRAGGRVAFVRTADGAWFVSEWILNIPLTETVRQVTAGTTPLAGRPQIGEGRRAIAGMKTVGGALLTVSVGDSIIWRGPRTRLTVRVHDENSRIISLAEVAILQTERRARTDTSGVASFQNLYRGTYTLRASTATLDTFALAASVVDFRVPDSGDVAVNVVIPSRDAAFERRCAHEWRDSTLTLIRLDLADSISRTELTGANVELVWTGVAETAGQTTRLRGRHTARENPQGTYWVCGFPRGMAALLRVRDGEGRSAMRQIKTPRTQDVIWFNLRLGFP